MIELLVVLGIIGILAGVLIASFSSGGESARATKCLANMKNLASAWTGGVAGSQETLGIGMERTTVKSHYDERRGWISSATQGLYPSESHQTFESIGFLDDDRERREYALSNGWMYAALGRSADTFVCPTHAKDRQGRGKSRPNWSYFMNAYMGWDAGQGSHSYIDDSGHLSKPDLTNADRLLLFAEIPFLERGPGEWKPTESSSATEKDAVLQYKGCNKAPTTCCSTAFDGNENIGGNHRSGKNWFAHVAFADGHVEKLRVDNMTSADLIELTTWLCTGKSVGRTGNRYEELK